MDIKVEDFVALEWFNLNEHSGVYNRGQVYNHRQKVTVAVAYSKAKKAKKVNGGSRPNITAIAKECKVSWHYVVKVKNKLDTHGRLLREDELRNSNAEFIVVARTMFFKTGCGRSLAFLFSFFLQDLLS